MAGLFDPSFRGAGSPGAPGVGTTQQGLQLVEQGKNKLATQGLALEQAQAQQPAALQQAELDSVIQTARNVSALPNRQSQLDFLIKNREAIGGRDGDSTHTDDGIRLLQEGAQTGDFTEFDESIGELVNFNKKPLSTKEKAEIAKLEAETGKLSAETTKITTGTKPAAIPPALIEGLSPDVAAKGQAAFEAAGGGNDGFNAFSKVVDQGSELERRQASPKIIEATFPNATDAERAQIQGVMDSAKTTESGLKAAAGVRAEQRRTKKAQGFQDRAVTLLDSILASDELDDVLGSVEGAVDFRFQDSEAELISDITEAENILTADNMDLMTGVLSESDIKILKNLAGGGLNRKRTPERFKADVQSIRDKLASQKVVTIDEQRGDDAEVDFEAKKARLAELRAKANQ